MAEVLADCGARVTLADIDADLLEASTSALAQRGCRVRSAVVDVSDAAQVQALFDGVVEAMVARGLALTRQPQAREQLGVAVRTAFCRDPSGNLIELTDLLPA
mgnify:CR=1 FL=1